MTSGGDPKTLLIHISDQAEQPKEPTEAQAKAGKPKRPQEMVKRKGHSRSAEQNPTNPALDEN